MTKRPFETLGIAPTSDGRAIRAAFLRLARIYHPDRFVGAPDDVRAEAERRMKEATIAYESLRHVKQEPAPPLPSLDDQEIRARARKYVDAMEAKQARDELDRARWRQWEEAERRANEKQKLEADIAARIASEVGGVPVARTDPEPKAEPAPIAQPGPSSRDTLSERLDAARRGETSPLVSLRPEEN